MTARTDMQRLGRLLARRLEEAGVSREDGVSVDDLHRSILPYHLCRAELGLATKAEYDLLLLELIAESGFVKTDEPRLVTAVRKERASPEPGLAFLRHFAASRLELLDVLADDMSASLPEPQPPASSQPRPRASAGSLSAKVRPAHPRRPSAPRPARPAPASRRAATGCWSCAEPLPDRRGLRYCPHCGEDQTVRPCRACDTELERGWAYCPLCGEPAARRH